MQYDLCGRCGSKKYRYAKHCAKCSHEFQRGINHPRWKAAGICPDCGGKKTADSNHAKRCKQCSRKYQRGTFHWNYGKHWPDEVKMKISLANTGKRMGEENHKFNPHRQIRRTYRFPNRQWKEKVLLRDNRTCRICKSKLILSVHHIIPYKENPKNLKLENGITLCGECHKITFGREYLFVHLFKEILKNGFNSVELSQETTPSQQEQLRKVLWACVTVKGE